MCPSVLMKKGGNKTKNMCTSGLFSLPFDLLTEVLAYVATTSSEDYFNVKLSCKYLGAISEDKYILKNMSLDRFPVLPWKKNNERAELFVEKCKQNDNPECYYREGVMKYIVSKEIKLGLEYLEYAAESGHAGASYTLGLILACSEDKEKQMRGVEILKTRMISNEKKQECRRQYEAIKNFTWPRNELNNNTRQQDPSICGEHKLQKYVDGFYRIDDDRLEEISCQACKHECEILIFRKILNI